MNRYLATLVLILALAESAFSDVPAEVTIGALADLTGPNAPNGESCRQGYEVARRWLTPEGTINGRPIRIVVGDHAGDARVGINEFKKLIDVDQALAVVSIRSQVGMAINPISEQRKVPLLGIVGHSEFVNNNPYSFRFLPSTTVEGSYLAKTALERGAERMAIITLEDEWTISLERAFRTEFEKSNRVVFRDTILPSDTEYTSLITRLKLANPDSVFVNLAVAQAGLFVRKLREQGFTGAIYSNFWASYEEVINAAGADNMEDVVFVAVNLDKPVFVARYRELFPHARPGVAAYACYSALAELLQLFKKNPTLAHSHELYSMLSRETAVNLLDETLPITGREVQFEIVCHIVKSGIPTPLKQNPS